MQHLLNRHGRESNFVESGNKYLENVVQEIENLQLYARLNSYRDIILLALLDRVVTTARAVIHLVRGGFADQAFGLSRTSIEAFFFLKYIENNESERRAKRYLDYFGKDRQQIFQLMAKHHPQLKAARPPDYEELMAAAKQFKSPYKWYEENSLKEVAYEKSTWALNEAGDPEDWEYAYDFVYKLASHEVHATSVALELRVAEFFENSRYPPSFKFSKPTSPSDGDYAIVNVCTHCQAAILHVFHAFDVEVPARINQEFENWRAAAGIASPASHDNSITP
jgi:hypothetical protein